MMQRCVLSAVLVCLWLVAAGSEGLAWRNVLQDPGFERYRFDDEKGCYVPTASAAWREVGLGQASVRHDRSGWTAPPDMLVERPLGFTPGAHGYEGPGATQNKGWIVLEQDIVDADLFAIGQPYEAWVWLGGAGADNEVSSEQKEEIGGWEIFFYDHPNTSAWTDANAVQRHHATLDYCGEPNSFVRVAGFGSYPRFTVGFRMRVWAATWPSSGRGANYDTRVGLDNAHFAIMEGGNLLRNGNFEEDLNARDFVGWQRPAPYPFPAGTFQPIDINEVYGGFFNQGGFLPYFDLRWAYGYLTYLSGWVEDSFSFGQTVAWNGAPGEAATLMGYWIMNTAEPAKAAQIRDVGGWLEFAIRYLESGAELHRELIEVRWPVASHPANRNPQDMNANRAYNPRFRLTPPDGTTHIEYSVNVIVNMPYAEGRSHQAFGLDNFWLGPAGPEGTADTVAPSLLVR